MEISLEQSLASVVRYIQDNSEDGTKLYFEEIPEDFYVPSVYFQTPYTAGRQATLQAFCTAITMDIWFMESEDWIAYAKAAEMRDGIMLDKCLIPVVDEESGEATGKYVRVNPPDTRRIDEGVIQLALTFDVYFQPGDTATKASNLYFAWHDAVLAICE